MVMETNLRLACAGRRATPKGVERAPGSGTLPLAAIAILQIYYSLYYDKENRKCQDAGKKFSEFSEFSESEKKKPGPMPRRIAVAFLESAVYFTRKAVSAVCPAIRSSTVTCQWPGSSFRAIGSGSSNAPSLSA